MLLFFISFKVYWSQSVTSQSYVDFTLKSYKRPTLEQDCSRIAKGKAH